jgi:hypothetical protein
MRRALVAVLCAACASKPPAPAKPSVRVTNASCLRGDEVEARIAQVFIDHHADRSGLVAHIVETGVEPASVTLQVVRGSGDVGLDRSYTFSPTDCASAPQLLALSVDRWLTSFPEWAEPPPAPTRWNEVVVTTAVNSMWLPIGVDGELGALVDRGPRNDRFGATVLVRASIPQTFGSGRFQQTAFLAGASWRHRMGPWASRVELRGGALLVSGIGLADNSRDWLAWWELAGFFGRDMSWGVVGLEIAATALRDHAVTSDGLVSEDIPLLRVGVGGMFQIR